MVRNINFKGSVLLFDNSMAKDAVVADMGSWNDVCWTWNLMREGEA
jgi:hypothetical protein